MLSGMWMSFSFSGEKKDHTISMGYLSKMAGLKEYDKI